MLSMKSITTPIQNFWDVLALLQIVKVCHMDTVVLYPQHLMATLCKVHLDLDKLHLEIVQRCVFCVLVITCKVLVL